MSGKKFYSGRTVLVTGASTGIGRCVALDFAREGADLALAARSVDKLEALAEQIRGLGQKAEVFPADLSRSGAAVKLVDSVLARCGKVDILVNNAGIGYVDMVVDVNLDKARELMEINFWSVVAATQRVLPHMLKRGSGQIINISSIAGKRAFPMSSMYNASKFALEAFTESLRGEVYRSGIQVISICPSVTETPFFEHPYVKGSAQERSSQKMKRTPVEKVSKLILNASKKGKRDVHITFPGWLIVRLNAWFPRFFDWVVDRFEGNEVEQRNEEIRKESGKQ